MEQMLKVLTFGGVPLLVEWMEGKGLSAHEMPRSPGLYAQIYWPDRAVRIGQSSNIHTRLREATAWANAMHLGTAREKQLRRKSELCERVKATGNEGFEYFVVSNHPCLSEKTLRMGCEVFLFGWFEATGASLGWKNWNKERVRSDLRPIFEETLELYGKAYW